MTSLSHILLAGAGGFLGTVARFLCYQCLPLNRTFAITWTINVIGSFLLGVLLPFFTTPEGSDTRRIFWALGFCGGFTTFSAFSWENLQLLREQRFGLAALYMGGSLVTGLLATYGGYRLSNLLHG